MLSIVLTALCGIVLDKVAYKLLRDAPRISALISAIGVSFFLENLGLVVFGGRPKAFARPEFFSRVIEIGGVRTLSITFVIPLFSILLLVALWYLIYNTKAGLAMRAISKDMEIARLMGIDVNRTISLTFAIGSALAFLILIIILVWPTGLVGEKIAEKV